MSDKKTHTPRPRTPASARIQPTSPSARSTVLVRALCDAIRDRDLEDSERLVAVQRLVTEAKKQGTKMPRKFSYPDLHPLLVAVVNLQFDILKYLVDQGVIHVDATHAGGDSNALSAAIQHGCGNMVAYLLQDAKADPNFVYLHYVGERVTPLRLAVRNGRVTMIKWLVMCGADARQELDGSRSQLLHKKVVRENTALYEWLVHDGRVDCEARNYSDETPLFLANDVEQARALVEVGKVNVNALDRERMTPLLYHICYGHWDIVEYLLTVPGIFVERPSVFGPIPIVQAVKWGPCKVVRALLVQRNANCNVLHSAGRLSTLAAQYERDETYAFLTKFETLLAFGCADIPQTTSGAVECSPSRSLFRNRLFDRNVLRLVLQFL